MLEVVEPLIIASARKHGVADDDILHAFNHDHGSVIVHAMTARKKYLR
jgi:hypothetical protein